MQIEDLDYDLPPELIAQFPAPRREDARLLVLERATGALHDRRFGEIGEWLRPGDCLALNETRVIPARLETRRARAGGPGGRVELLVVRRDADGCWRVLARPARKAGAGVRLETDDGCLGLEVIEEGDSGERRVRVIRGDLMEALSSHGTVPLPPYIHRPPDPEDHDRYQTVFARVEGAVAAPTAGLHFTHELLALLADRGVRTARVLLHVGPGTFRPIGGDPATHRMDEEYYEVSESAAAALAAARTESGRIVAVGTTVVRSLESACDAHGGHLGPAQGWTGKYILPPYRFQVVDALVTNFHLPRTTLLLLVAAFAGVEPLRRAYAHAVASRYRFYSYGDAMLIL